MGVAEGGDKLPPLRGSLNVPQPGQAPASPRKGGSQLGNLILGALRVGPGQSPTGSADGSDEMHAGPNTPKVLRRTLNRYMTGGLGDVHAATADFSDARRITDLGSH